MPPGYRELMELRHLRYFVGVAEDLNFTKASQRLRVAQPALSRQIRQLEDEVGSPLFIRDRKGVNLTKAGESFLRDARGILAQSDQALKSAQQSGKADGGTLNLGYVWGLFHSVVPAAVGRFRQQYPASVIHLLDLTATEQVSGLEKGSIDAGFIGFADEADTAGLQRKQIGECQFVVAIPERHSLAKTRKIDLASLAGELFLAISDDNYPGAAKWMREACARAGFRPRIVQAAGRGHILIGLVAAGCGMALIPQPLEALPHPGVVFRALNDSPAAGLYVAWNERRLSATRDAFLGSLVNGDVSASIARTDRNS
jgi:DNA-binding transcriptional LysR family regulator